MEKLAYAMLWIIGAAILAYGLAHGLYHLLKSAGVI